MKLGLPTNHSCVMTKCRRRWRGACHVNLSKVEKRLSLMIAEKWKQLLWVKQKRSPATSVRNLHKNLYWEKVPSPEFELMHSGLLSLHLANRASKRPQSPISLEEVLYTRMIAALHRNSWETPQKVAVVTYFWVLCCHVPLFPYKQTCHSII